MTADKQLLTADEIFWHHEWESTFMIDMHSKFYEARMIRTMVLAEVNLGQDSYLASLIANFDRWIIAVKSWWIFWQHGWEKYS